LNHSKSDMRTNVGVILAGGGGKRTLLDTPKQFFKVAGKMIIEHTLDVFQKNEKIDEIIIVTNPKFVRETEDIVIKNQYSKVKKILKGGESRHLSSLAAINSMNDEDNVNVIFHDAVRPLISQKILNDVITALDTYQAVDVAVPSADTIIEVDNNIIEGIPDRDKFRKGQTPQAFYLPVIKKAYQIALKDPLFKSTDDCGVLQKYLPEVKIFVVMGDESNMKLTYKEDTYLIEKLFQLRSVVLNINENDLSDKLKDKVIVIYGANSGIGAEIYNLSREYGAKAYPFSRSLGNIDISDQQSVKDSLEKVYNIEKKINFIVNCAAILVKQPIENISYRDLYTSINTNLLGAVLIAKESLRYLKETKGTLIYFTSSSYTRGRAYYSLYSATKSAVVNFVQAIASEWEPFGIKVNCINPERTKTPMRAKNFGYEPDNSLLNPKEVARVTIQALFMDYTGQVIDIKLSPALRKDG